MVAERFDSSPRFRGVMFIGVHETMQTATQADCTLNFEASDVCSDCVASRVEWSLISLVLFQARQCKTMPQSQKSRLMTKEVIVLSQVFPS
jgi:hypothetical protein